MAGTVMEKSAWQSALQLVRLTAAIPVGAVTGGYLLRWVGVRPVCITGLVFMGTGLLVMSGWETQVDELRLTLPLITAGLGFGLVIPPIAVSALSAAPSHYWGAAASLVTASRMVGMALGLAALSAWGIERFYSLTADVSLGAFIPGYRGLLDRCRRHRVPKPLLDHGVPVPGRHPAGPADEGGRRRRNDGPHLSLCSPEGAGTRHRRSSDIDQAMMEDTRVVIDHIDNIAVSTETHHNNLNVLRFLDVGLFHLAEFTRRREVETLEKLGRDNSVFFTDFGNSLELFLGCVFDWFAISLVSYMRTIQLVLIPFRFDYAVN